MRSIWISMVSKPFSAMASALALAGTVKKKLGFSLTSSKPNDAARRYRIKTRVR